MGWPQKATDIIYDNTTADGITNSTIKCQCSCAMNMRYFCDQVQNLSVYVCWAPGLENLAHYFTKHHIAAHHTQVRQYYLHLSSSPHVLPKAPVPWDLQGCIKPPNPIYLAKTLLANISPMWKIPLPCGSSAAEATCREHKNPTLVTSTNQMNRSNSLFQQRHDRDIYLVVD